MRKLKVLEKSKRYGVILEMMYMSKDNQISKRRIRVLQVGVTSFKAYCYMRKSQRTFIIDNVLALVPLVAKEKVVI